jgi:hypothetical protein
MPSNYTPTDAVDITSYPYSTTQDVSAAPTSVDNISSCAAYGTAQVWYKFTAAAGVKFLCINADKAPGSDAAYNPYCSIWVGTALSLTEYVVGLGSAYCANLQGGYYFRVPVTPGTTYWIQIVQRSLTLPNPSILSLSVIIPDTIDAPIGSLVISDDEDGFPAAILDPATGTFLQYPVFPAGEFTGVQPNGKICTQNGTVDQEVAFLDSSFTEVATANFAPSFVYGILSDDAGFFYIGTATTSADFSVRKYTEDGVHVYTKSLPSDFHNKTRFAISLDGTKFYSMSSAASAASVYVYDLVNDTQLGTITLATMTNWQVEDHGYFNLSGQLMLALKNNTAHTAVVRAYNITTGAIVTSYTPTHITFPNRFAKYNDDSFVLWGYVWPTTNNNAIFEVMDLTGVQVSEILNIPVTGVSKTTANVGIHAISNSCPVFALQAALAGPAATAFSGIYKLVPGKLNDTLYTSFSPVTSVDFKFPDPQATFSLIGED